MKVYAGMIFFCAALYSPAISMAAGEEGSPACPGKFEEIKKSYQLYTFRALRETDPETFQLFERVRLHPEALLSGNDKKLLQEKNLMGLFEQWKGTNSLIKKLNYEFSLWYRSKLHRGNEKFWARTAKFLGKAAFPYWNLFKMKGKAERIAAKILANPQYVLNKKEAAFILRKGLNQDLDRFRADIQRGLGGAFATISHIRTTGRVATWGITIPTVSLSLLMNDYISSDQSWDESDPKGMSKLDDKVELLFLSPVPHASIRVDGIVYNYGVGNVSRYSLKEFAATLGYPTPFLYDSHTRIELKLTPEEKERLTDYLEADVGKLYPLMIPYIDCVSQTNKAVTYATGKNVPYVADRSQAMTIAYWKLRKLIGDPTVGNIYFAADSKQHAPLAKLEDAVGNALDSMTFLRAFGRVFLLAPILDAGHTTFEWNGFRRADKKEK